MANHTSIHALFSQILKEEMSMRSRGAFLSQFRAEKMFSDGLEEFEHAEEVVKTLIAEYKAAEKANYLSW